MPTKTIRVTIEAPESISSAARETVERQAHETAVLAFWQGGQLSTRQAADELGLTYHEFLELLATKGIPVEQDMFDGDALEQARRQLAQGKA